MTCETCKAVTVYKDNMNKYHESLDECKKANRRYKRMEASRSAAEYFAKEVDSVSDLCISVDYYGYYSSKDRRKQLQVELAPWFVRNHNVLIETLEIYYKHLGDDL